MTRRLTTLLWVAVGVYGTGVVCKAWSDLTTAYVVEGEFRNYHLPYEAPHGRVVDPRPGRLEAEVAARYEIQAVAAKDRAGWRHALSELEPSDAVGVGTGAHPRVVFVEGGPWLVVGVYGVRPVVFDPRHGVVLLREGVVPPKTPALELRQAREAPW